MGSITDGTPDSGSRRGDPTPIIRIDRHIDTLELGEKGLVDNLVVVRVHLLHQLLLLR